MKNMLYLSLSGGAPHAHLKRLGASPFNRRLAKTQTQLKEKKRRFDKRVYLKNLKEIADLEAVLRALPESRHLHIQHRLRIIELKIANLMITGAQDVALQSGKGINNDNHPLAAAFRQEITQLKNDLCPKKPQHPQQSADKKEHKV